LQKQRIAAESSAVDKESSAIRKENAELEAERLAIEELKKFTPQDPQIPIRHQALKRQYALVGERGRNLGLRKAALKTAKARHTQQIEEAAERRMYAKAARELQQDLQSQQYTPAPAQSSDSYLQAQPQTQQIYTPSPTQPGNGYGQMHPQNQTLGVGDFLNAQQNPQMQSAAPAQSGYGYFQQHPQTQQMYAPTPVGSMQPKYPVNMQPPTHPSEIAALDTLSITDSSNITSNCNALQNALASTGGPVSFPLPTQVYVNYKTHTPQPVGRNWKDPSELAAWQKAQKLGKIVLQEEKLKETEQRKRELDHTPNEIALWQQRQREAARQQLEKKNTAGQQQMQMESDTSEVLYPDRLPARYGTGAYVGTGFSSPELTRDHSTILTQEMLHERDARRQVLNKIIHST
jgi:hypothetical protein